MCNLQLVIISQSSHRFIDNVNSNDRVNVTFLFDLAMDEVICGPVLSASHFVVACEFFEKTLLSM